MTYETTGYQLTVINDIKHNGALVRNYDLPCYCKQQLRRNKPQTNHLITKLKIITIHRRALSKEAKRNKMIHLA